MTLHEGILSAVGLDLSATRIQPEPSLRDPAFRDRVLRAYDYRCGVCGTTAMLDGRAFALEAAHVRWHSSGGPCVVGNGVALCPIHHALLDYGAWSLTPDRTVLVSERATGSAIAQHLLAFHRQPLHGPQPGVDPIQIDHITWHQDNVFKKPGRAA